MIDYNQFPNESRVWIYQSNTAFSEEQANLLRKKLQHFVAQWQSHGAPVKAWADIKYNRFIVLMVDENQEAPSGCSIDSSVAMIKEIEVEMNVDLFDRLNFAYKTDSSTVESADRIDFSNLYASSIINDQTIVFNNLVNTKIDLENKWEVPLADSWHANMV
ncbi:hypothetical protein [Aureispira anguillae]|uniref:ABC transporter ATPase n=1 Tax=Aureispira anguillae TaxID=2864201 RepID=A0A915YFB5_9BACT|nr:hypothetical protein [Aureispira anguillae]BDS12095.1 hypothetical protein AsAng_0028100 [Aureispira anguillae]